MRKWLVPELDRDTVRRLQSRFGLPVITSMLLTLRGIVEEEDIDRFFSEGTTLDDPLLIKDMDRAVERIRHAVKYREKICVFGDYDFDGVTSTAILYSYLKEVFADVICYIPDRNEEGYGMNKDAVKKLKDKKIDLIITVDNGITAIEEIEYAASLGIDVVVTDHHKPLDILPKAVAVVDPHRSDETYGFHDYSGAGLALKLIIAVEGSSDMVIENYADLAALGTIADIVPLNAENRDIVKTGLFYLNNTERVGLYQMFTQMNLDRITSGIVGFRIAPRINAAGRLTSPHDALNLLLTESDEYAEKKAEKLDALNVRRQEIENGIFEDIIRILENDETLTYNRIIVVSSDKWNSGVIGIVSSRITEKYGKPSIIISESDEICKASGRSIPGFSLVDAVFSCSGMLEKYGGHPMAVGFSIKRERISDFVSAINAYADKLDHMPAPSLRLECYLNPDIIVPDIVKEIECFEPFGCGNPKPVFGIKNLTLDKISAVGGGKHLRLSFSRGKSRFTMMKFFCLPHDFPFSEGDRLDVAVNLELSSYQGRENVTFSIKDLKPSGYDPDNDVSEIQAYESYKKGIITDTILELYPERDAFETVYKYFRMNPRPVYRIDGICDSIEGLGAFRLLMVLDILQEIEVISYSRDSYLLRVELPEVKVKSSLHVSYTYKKLREDIENARKDKVLSGL